MAKSLVSTSTLHISKPAPNYEFFLAIFLGAVWAYILFFIFFGPEMTQEEREEEAALAKQYEELRTQGVSLQEIGAGRAKALGPGEQPGMNEKAEEKAAEISRHVEKV